MRNMQDHNQALILSSLRAEIQYLTPLMQTMFKEDIEFLKITTGELEERQASEQGGAGAGAGLVPAEFRYVKAVLVSLHEDMEIAYRYFGHCRIIKVDRMLAGDNVARASTIAAGRKLLVCNDPEDEAVETVEMLHAMGVDHLTLTPWWPGCGMDLSSYDAVLYTGFYEYVPSGMKEYIDIGYRHIAFSTLFEISIFFGLETGHIRRDYEESMALLVRQNYALKRRLDREKTMEKPGRRMGAAISDGETLPKKEGMDRGKTPSHGFAARYHFSNIKGNSPMLQDAITLSGCYAESDMTVLITGSSGTGKELFAQAMHNGSARSGGPFVAINFAALPETLVESQLFGYEAGAFTGASRGGKPGLFEIARHGTVFLDEIGDTSLAVQARLLRVLEEREVMRIGSARYIPIDVRVICATNQDLQKLVQNGRFREDLFYRVNVLPLHIPDLKDRKEDIPPILSDVAREYGVRRNLLSGIQELFLEYDWPGNVRELKAAIQYFSVIGRNGHLCDDQAFERFARAWFRQKKADDPRHAHGMKKSHGEAPGHVLREIYMANQENR